MARGNSSTHALGGEGWTKPIARWKVPRPLYRARLDARAGRRHAFSCRALPLPTPLSNVDPVAAAKAQCRTRSNGVGCFRARVPKAFVQRASAFGLVAHCADQTADDGRELMGGDHRH